MNNKIIGFCILMTCYGCKVNKEKRERLYTASQTQSQIGASSSWMQLHGMDSSYRSWHYAGDSTFFFHPDAGLWSRSGQITYMEQKRSETKEEQLLSAYDSLKTTKTKSQTDTRHTWIIYFMRNWIWILFVSLAVAMYWIAGKVKKSARW